MERKLNLDLPFVCLNYVCFIIISFSCNFINILIIFLVTEICIFAQSKNIRKLRQRNWRSRWIGRNCYKLWNLCWRRNSHSGSYRSWSKSWVIGNCGNLRKGKVHRWKCEIEVFSYQLFSWLLISVSMNTLLFWNLLTCFHRDFLMNLDASLNWFIMTDLIRLLSTFLLWYLMADFLGDVNTNLVRDVLTNWIGDLSLLCLCYISALFIRFLFAGSRNRNPDLKENIIPWLCLESRHDLKWTFSFPSPSHLCSHSSL